jgi:Methyltransferase domain
MPPSRRRIALHDLVLHEDTGVFVPPRAGTQTGYLDGAERYLLEALQGTRDVRLFSTELRLRIRDWPSLYHLTPYRATILDALGLRTRDASVLELGAGCGAVTRWLGERFDAVHALEGSLARARVARERTRDLAGVQVTAANFFDLDFAHAYDLTTLIGVLEYSHLYHPEFRHDPWRAARSNLELARSSLRDEGMLVIAIENKFGLKYLAGAHEDHAGKQFEGIVGYPNRSSAVTWSAAELERLVLEAGFEGCDFYLAFPDYKLARTIIDASVADSSHFPANWVETPFPDRVAPRTPLYNESLALREITSAGLLRELANSFVVLAYNGERGRARARLGIEDGWVARHYSFDRHPAFCKRTSLEHESGGGLIVRNTAAVTDAPSAPACLALTQRLTDEPFHPGHQLHFELLELGAAGLLADGAPALLRQLRDFLVEHHGTHLTDDDGVPLLLGDALDAVWWNIVRDPDSGVWHGIDGEWTFAGLLPLDYVLWRGMHHLVARFGILLGSPVAEHPERFTLEAIAALVPLSRGGGRIAYYRELESYVQQAVGAELTGRDIDGPPPSVQRLVDLAEWHRNGCVEGDERARPRRVPDDASLRPSGDALPVKVLAFAEELVAAPELLAAYAQAFPDGERVQLVAYAPDGDPAEIAPGLEAALAACTGSDPDVVLVAVPGGCDVERTLAAGA